MCPVALGLWRGSSRRWECGRASKEKPGWLAAHHSKTSPRSHHLAFPPHSQSPNLGTKPPTRALEHITGPSYSTWSREPAWASHIWRVPCVLRCSGRRGWSSLWRGPWVLGRAEQTCSRMGAGREGAKADLQVFVLNRWRLQEGQVGESYPVLSHGANPPRLFQTTC